MKRLAFVSVGRSDFGLLTPVLREAMAAPDLEVHLIISGQHLSQGIGQSGLKDLAHQTHIVKILLTSDSAVAIGQSIGFGVTAFTNQLADLQPDLLIVLGDRYETLAAAIAAVPLNIPIAHIHGGELTLGAIDDQIRHAISKLSHLHFVAATEFARRVAQMGEEPWRIVVSGAPGLDLLSKFVPSPREQVADELGIDPTTLWLLATIHPETLFPERTAEVVRETLAALVTWDGAIIFTSPNADAGSEQIRNAIKEFLRSRPQDKCVEALGSKRYFDLLHHAEAMIGNSSSGLIEAPSVPLAVVNIGERQTGRLSPRNVINCPPDRVAIARAIRKSTDPQFKSALRGMVNPYGDGNAAAQIVSRLRGSETREVLLSKKFVDQSVETAEKTSKRIQANVSRLS